MASDPARFRQAVLMAKYRAFRPASINYYQQLKLQEQLTHAELDALREVKRDRIVEFAFRNCPFYQDLYRETLGDRGVLRDPGQFAGFLATLRG